MPDSSGGSGKGGGQAARGQSQLLPSSVTEKEFGKVYVQQLGNEQRVEFTVWVPDEAEGWQTGVALDASASMKDWYGRSLRGSVPPDVAKEYDRKGWTRSHTEDGRRVMLFEKKAHEDAIQRGFLKFTDNIVEPLARDFTAYLAGELDVDGGTTVLYWACGDGSAYEVVGDLTEAQCRTLELRGPKSVTFGMGTRLAPAMRYFVDRFVDAPRGMYVFVTDGRLDDLDDVKRYTTQLAREIEAGKRNPVKCVLIGVGDKIDEGQMEELDDLDTGTDVDVWDHKIAQEMRALNEIIVELVDESKIVAPNAVIYDDSGQVAERFTDGLPAKAEFTMPASSKYFELEVGGRRIKQSVVMPAS
jgi:hypothetical protein